MPTAFNAAAVRLLLDLPTPLAAYYFLLGMGGDVSLHLQAPTALSIPAREAMVVNEGDFPARTCAAPVKPAFPPLGFCNYREAAKRTAEHIQYPFRI